VTECTQTCAALLQEECMRAIGAVSENVEAKRGMRPVFEVVGKLLGRNVNWTNVCQIAPVAKNVGRGGEEGGSLVCVSAFRLQPQYFCCCEKW
jgi:hypothetical protein